MKENGAALFDYRIRRCGKMIRDKRSDSEAERASLETEGIPFGTGTAFRVRSRSGPEMLSVFQSAGCFYV